MSKFELDFWYVTTSLMLVIYLGLQFYGGHWSSLVIAYLIHRHTRKVWKQRNE